MKIKDILQVKGSQVWMINMSQSVQDAIRMLTEKKVGALLVSDDAGVEMTGIISERDIICGLNNSPKSPAEMKISDLMTRRVIVASPEDDIQQIMTTMTEKRVRHIPVFEQNRLEGMISIGDVVKALIQDSAHEIQCLKEYVYGPGQ